jgi:hypothetical protein
MSDIEWGELPPDNRGRPDNKWAEIADELRDRPGEWALIAKGVDSTIANKIRTGRYRSMPRGQFEAVSRNSNVANRRADIWARYIGGANNASAHGGTP